MKEIKQGTIYGLDIVLKVPDDYPDYDLVVNEYTLEKYIASQIKNALNKQR